MTARKAPDFAEAAAQARSMMAEARLNDPGEHYPYKLDHAHELIDENGPMGPDGEDDDRVRVEDVMSRRIAEASNDMIEAQATFHRNPTPATRAAYKSAQDDLVAARRAHRRSRVDANGNPTGAILGIQSGLNPDHMVGPRLRRVGEE